MRKLLNLFRSRRARLEHDLDRELAYHVDRRVEDMRASGMAAEEAQRRARVEFGGVTQAKEDVRDTWIWRALDNLLRDVRFGVRALSKNWTFTLGAGAVLALGIAANTAIFSIVNSVLLRPLAYPEADRIVTIETLRTNTGRVAPEVAGPDFLDWQASGIFEVLGHSDGENDVATMVEGRAQFASQRTVSGGFFDVFGLPPSAGRLLTREDDVRPLPIAVISHQLAETNFGSAQAAVGKSLIFFGLPVRIVGVAAPGFRYPDRTDIWMPNGGTNRTNRAGHPYQAIGKLAAGVDLAGAQARMRALGDRLAGQYPESRFKNFVVTPLRSKVTGDVRPTLWVLMGAVALVLIIACANIANLLLARSAARGREIALRSALGAGRGRVVRQLLTESFVLAAVAAVAGVLLTRGLLGGLVALAPANLPRIEEVRIDGVVLAFALGLAFVATLCFGLLPALSASRLSLSDALKQGGAKTSAGGTRWIRPTIIVAEVALSVMLLAAAGLLLRSFRALNDVDLGFVMDRVVVAQTQAVPPPGPDGRRLRAVFYRDFVQRLRSTPGISAAAGIATLPLGRELTQGAELVVEGRPEGRPGERLRGHAQSISAGFFETLQIPLRAGRDFNDGDTPDRPRVGIVNETLARALFPDESPIGRRIKTLTSEWVDIVGVSSDTRWYAPSEPPRAELYTASLQGGGSLTILARASGDTASAAATVRRVLEEMNPGVPVRLDTMEDVFADALAYPRFRAELIGGLGIAAALLAAVGIFSVLAYLVGQRSREIAVRRAIGASTRDVLRLILGNGARLIALGLVIGLTGALALARALEGLLYQVSPWDPASYAGATAVLGLVAVLATLLPALRAAHIDPMVALRQD